LTGYFGKGYFNVALNLTAPQWHCAACVVLSALEVSSTKERMAGSMGLGRFTIVMTAVLVWKIKSSRKEEENEEDN